MPTGFLGGLASKAFDALAGAKDAVVRPLETNATLKQNRTTLDTWARVHMDHTRRAVQQRLESGALFAEPGSAFLSAKPKPLVLTQAFPLQEDQNLQQALQAAAAWEALCRRLHSNLLPNEGFMSLQSGNLPFLTDFDLPDPIEDHHSQYCTQVVASAWGKLQTFSSDSDKVKFALFIDGLNDLFRHQPTLIDPCLQALNHANLIDTLKDCLYCGDQAFKASQKRRIREGMAAWLLHQLGQDAPQKAQDKPDATPKSNALEALLKTWEAKHLACRNMPAQSWNEHQAKLDASSAMIAPLQALPLYQLFTVYSFAFYHEALVAFQQKRQQIIDDLTGRQQVSLQQCGRINASAKHLEPAPRLPEGLEDELRAIDPSSLRTADDFDQQSHALQTKLLRIEARLEILQAHASRAALEKDKEPQRIAQYKKDLERLADQAAKLAQSHKTFQSLVPVQSAKDAFDQFHGACNAESKLSMPEAFDTSIAALEAALQSYEEACQEAAANQKAAEQYQATLKTLANQAGGLHDAHTAKLAEVAKAKRLFDERHRQLSQPDILTDIHAFDSHIALLEKTIKAYEETIKKAKQLEKDFQTQQSTYQATIKQLYDFNITAFQHQDFNLDPLEQTALDINQNHLHAASIEELKGLKGEMEALCQDANISLKKHQAVVAHLAKLEKLRTRFEGTASAPGWMLLAEVKAAKQQYETLYAAASQPSDINPDALQTQTEAVETALTSYQQQLTSAGEAEKTYNDLLENFEASIQCETKELACVAHNLAAVEVRLNAIKRSQKTSIADLQSTTNEIRWQLMPQVHPWTTARLALCEIPTYPIDAPWAVSWQGIAQDDFDALSRRLGFSEKNKWPSRQAMMDMHAWLAAPPQHIPALHDFITQSPRAKAMKEAYQQWVHQLRGHQVAVFTTVGFNNDTIHQVVSTAIQRTTRALQIESLASYIIQQPDGTALNQHQSNYLYTLKNGIINSWNGFLNTHQISRNNALICSGVPATGNPYDNTIFLRMEQFYDTNKKALLNAIMILKPNPANVSLIKQYQAAAGALDKASTDISTLFDAADARDENANLDALDCIRADAIFRNQVRQNVLDAIKGAHAVNAKAAEAEAAAKPTPATTAGAIVPRHAELRVSSELAELVARYQLTVTQKGSRWHVCGQLPSDAPTPDWGPFGSAIDFRQFTLTVDNDGMKALTDSLQIPSLSTRPAQRLPVTLALPAVPAKTPWEMGGVFGVMSKTFIAMQPTPRPPSTTLALAPQPTAIMPVVVHPGAWTVDPATQPRNPTDHATSVLAFLSKQPHDAERALTCVGHYLYGTKGRFNKINQSGKPSLLRLQDLLQDVVQCPQEDITLSSGAKRKFEGSIVDELSALTIFTNNPGVEDSDFHASPTKPFADINQLDFSDPITVAAWADILVEQMKDTYGLAEAHPRTHVSTTTATDNATPEKKEGHTVLMALYHVLVELIQWLGSFFVSEEKPDKSDVELGMFAAGERGTETAPLTAVTVL